MSCSSPSSSESDSRATSREDLKDLSPCTLSNEDITTSKAKWISNETGSTETSDVSPSEKHREDQCCPRPSSTSVRHRYKTHTQLIKEKLDQIKAKMKKISEVHLHLRPERKAYHPFVWNSLSPYRDTTQIDHLLSMTAVPVRRNRCSTMVSESTRLSK